MTKMNPDAKAKIIEALRSGRYKQGKGLLRRGDRFCVWGVICDVSGQGMWSGDRCMWYVATPADAILRWAGFPDDVITAVIDGVQAEITEHSDNGVTFEQLADAIEEQL